jgi:hypothetical protein
LTSYEAGGKGFLAVHLELVDAPVVGEKEEDPHLVEQALHGL